MSNDERKQLIEQRLDALLSTIPDNPIYEDHDSRAIYNYILSLKVLQETEKKEGDDLSRT